MICNAPTIFLAQLLDVHGPCDAISSACASGADAIGHAYELIRDGDASIMLTVASEAPFLLLPFLGDVMSFIAYRQASMISRSVLRVHLTRGRTAS